MSKKSKIKENLHHLLFCRTDWNTGYAKLLRESFIYKIPIGVHDELHHSVLSSVHKPPDKLLKETWEYLQDSPQVASYGIIEALKWLYICTPDDKFRRDIKKQINFFIQKL